MKTEEDEVEISVILKIPKNYYHVASGLVKIYDYENFDDYVGDLVQREVEMLLDGAAPLDDQIHYKLTGKDSPYIQDIKKIWAHK